MSWSVNGPETKPTSKYSKPWTNSRKCRRRATRWIRIFWTHHVRGDATWDRIRDDYQLLLIEPIPIISIATTAELKSLSKQFHWGRAKLDKMDFLLGYLDEIPIDDHKLVDHYATIDAHTQNRGEKMGKNDLWIAATAVLADATLLTTDTDFDRLHPHFLNVERIEPVR